MKPRISLCAITGNSSRYIARFLGAFAPLVDEVVLVRAIGSREPDDTFEIARHFCSSVHSPLELVLAEHQNEPGNAAWPHVDHFGAARQKSFDLATGDWIIWADTDDVIDAASIALVRDAFLKHQGDFTAFQWDYHVPDDQITVAKARLVRRGSCHWHHRVHEELRLDDESSTTISVTGAVITHRPEGPRSDNDARNLLLLQTMEAAGEMTPGHRFHLVISLMSAGKNEDAAALAVELLKEPSLATPERYELLMMLARLAPSQDQRAQMFIQALAVDPTRREAYADLALWCFAHGRWPAMLGWTRAMLAHPPPEEYVWNLRHKVYGWAGLRLHAIALRVNGRRITADTMQRNHFLKHGARISLLHATRGRPARAFAAQDMWLTRAADPEAIEHIFAIDEDDASSAPLAHDRCIVVPAGGGCVRAWNAAAAASSGGVLIQMSDDWEPPLHWDRLILDRIGDPSDPAVLAVSDGHRTDQLLCMAIMTRARYANQGHLLHPDFEEAAMFSDNHLTYRAYADGVVIEARDLVFRHMHPAFDPSVQLDATYAAQNAPEKYAKGKEIYERLKKLP